MSLVRERNPHGARLMRTLVCGVLLAVAGCQDNPDTPTVENARAEISANLSSAETDNTALAEGSEAYVFTPQVAGREASCATALQRGDRFDNSTRTWVLGFWSGLNAADGAIVGSDTDTNGVMAEVEKKCREEPSLSVMNGVYMTYDEMRKRAAGRPIPHN